MLHICQPYKHGLSIHHINIKIDTLFIFSKTGPPLLMVGWPHIESRSVRSLSQEHSDPLLSLGTEPRVDNLATANLRFNPLSCDATILVW